MKYLLGFLAIFSLIISPAFAVQTGGAGPSNPVVITGAITSEGYSKAPTLEITSGVTKLGAQTYTWPSVQGAADSFLKDSGSGSLTWEAISGTVPEPTAAGSLLVGTDTSGSWQSQSVSGDISITSTGVTTIAASAVTTDEIADGSVNAAKIADATITGTKLTTDIEISTSGNITSTGSIAASTFAGDGSALLNVPPAGSAGGDLTGTYPNPTITAEAITGPELANQVIKGGTLDDAAYSITLSNEGTGNTLIPGVSFPISNVVKMQNSAASLYLAQVASQVEDVGGVGALFSDKMLILSAPIVKATGPQVQLAIDTEGGNVSFVNEIDTATDVLTVNQSGVITAYSLPPSLYVKTTADQALTAEAIDLSSGISGTLGIQYGGTGTPEYPGSGEILVGDGLDNYSLRLISGDVSMNYLGDVAIRDGKISTSKLASNFILPINRGGTGIITTPITPQILLGYMGSYSLRTVSGDVSMDYLGNYTIGAGKITSDKLASNFTLPVNRGGTGATIYPTGEIVFGSGINPLQSASELSWDTSTNTIVVGQLPDIIGTPDTGLVIASDDIVTIGGLSGGAASGNDAGIILGSVRGGLDSPAALEEGDNLGSIAFIGHDGANGQMGASIIAEANQNWGIDAVGTTLTLSATNSDNSGETELSLSDGNISATGNLIVFGSAGIATTLEVSGSVIYTPSGDHAISTSGIGSELLASKVLLIKGDSALTTTNTIAAGEDGQMLVLIGQSETELIKFTGTGNLKLSANTDFTLGEGDIIQFIYVNSISEWVEISRTDN